MPIQEVNGGYRWGKSGKVYPTKAQAAKQARAAYASGYKGYVDGGIIPEGWADKSAKDSWTHDETGGERTQDTFAKDFAKYMLMTGIMSNPKARRNLGMAKMFRDQGPMGLGKLLGQRAGIKGLAKQIGPWTTLLQNKGGPLGLGSKGPLGLGIMQGLQDPRTRGLPGIMNRIKFAQAFPQIAGLGWLMNKVQPRIAGQKGILGQGLGPQLRNLASRFLPIKSYAEKHGMGQDMEEDLYPDIQEIGVTAQRRQTPEEKAEAFNRGIAMNEAMLRGRIEETGGLPFEKLSGLSPGVAQSMNQGLRASNIGKMLAKRAAARALTGKKAKYDRSGLDRKISSGGGGRK